MFRKILFIVVGLLATAAAQAQFDLSWNTIDGGGAMFTAGGSFELSGTIGQFDAGSPAQPMTGGIYSLVGGFWVVGSGSPCGGSCTGDLDGNCDVDINDLTTCLSGFGCIPPAICVCDIDGDGDGDLSDLAMILSNFGTTCP